MSRYYLAIGLVVLLMIMGSICQSANEPAAGSGSLVTRVRSSDRKDRLNAAKELREERQKTIQALMLIAGEESKVIGYGSAKGIAIELLGEYRATEAVNLLVKEITFTAPGANVEPIPAAGYLCVHSLAKIGVPSLNGIIERIGEDANETELKLFATVFRLVDGDDVAEMRVGVALKSALGKRKQNLSQLLILLKARQWYFLG